ncbi:MAG: hypothetical protein WC007_00765 [Pelobacteraceae bacterium]
MSVKRGLHSAGAMAFVAGIICLLVYLRALFCGFVNYDDPDYVLNNPLIRTLDWNMVVQAFREPHAGWWMPLTWISFAVDYRFWGLNPAGYHLTNIVLHALNTGLVVLIADRILLGQGAGGGGQAARLYYATLLLAGLLWGIHPLRVESVAWVVERKDVLNGLFTFSSALCYLQYVRVRETGKSSSSVYILSLVLFACSLLAKSISVVLPLMLLVLDYYPLRRLRNASFASLVAEKVPFFGFSALMTIITISLTGKNSFVVLISDEMFPWYERLLVSGNAILQYLRYVLWPAGITPYHIIPDPVPLVPYAVATVLVAAIFVLLLWYMRSTVWGAATWLLFIIPLLPVLSFLQNGDQGYAARFTYLPSVAPSIMAALLISFLYSRVERIQRQVVLVSLVLLLSGYAVMSYRLIAAWDNGGTMWTRVIDYAPSSAAYWRRAMYHFSSGNYQSAVTDYTAAIELVTPGWRPFLHNYYAHRAEALMAAGNYDAAVADLTTAIAAYPHPAYLSLRREAMRGLGKEREVLMNVEGKEPLGWYFEPLPEVR